MKKVWFIICIFTLICLHTDWRFCVGIGIYLPTTFWN